MVVLVSGLITQGEKWVWGKDDKLDFAHMEFVISAVSTCVFSRYILKNRA